MRILPGLNRGFAYLCIIGAATAAFGCDQLPSGQSLWIRLSAPITTYTAKAGDPVQAVLTEDLVCDNEVIMPMGAAIEGVVRSKRKVGWGIRHETAALELEFDSAIASGGNTVTFTARVEEVENARELVRNGVIQGIRSSDTFQGRISSRLIHLPTLNPYSDPVLIIYKATFPIFPEPEIYFPSGTDIRLRTTAEISVPNAAMTQPESTEDSLSDNPDNLDKLVRPLPWRVTTTKNVDADLLNLVFLGSKDQVNAAFRQAGWQNADPVSHRTVLKNMYALLNNSGYQREPMRTFLLDGRPEDMNWQKSLNSYGRRDHLRIWQWKADEAAASVSDSSSDSAQNSVPNPTQNSIWLSSSTHDTGAVLAVKYKGFVHHIASDIDDERSTVIRELTFAGCVRSVNYVSRLEVPAATYNATGDIMRTDGSVAVIALQDCHPIDPQLAINPQPDTFRPGNHVFRYIRRQILTFRNDIWRANVIYAAFDVGRMTVTAMRHQYAEQRQRSAMYVVNPSGSDNPAPSK